MHIENDSYVFGVDHVTQNTWVLPNFVKLHVENVIIKIQFVIDQVGKVL